MSWVNYVCFVLCIHLKNCQVSVLQFTESKCVRLTKKMVKYYLLTKSHILHSPLLCEYLQVNRWWSCIFIKEQHIIENTWINLLVVGHSICIYDGLKPLRKLVCPVKSWRLLMGWHKIQNRWYSSPTLLCATPQCLLNLIQVTNWTPTLPNKTFLSHVQVEHVHGVINGLDLLDLE